MTTKAKAKTNKKPETDKKPKQENKDQQNQLDRELADSFPASDPPLKASSHLIYPGKGR